MNVNKIKLMRIRTNWIHWLSPILAILFLGACEENMGTPVERYVVEQLKVYTADNEALYVNFNIFGDRIDALVENDGKPGSVFKLEFGYPEGIEPVSISPSLSSPIDCAAPVAFELLFPGDFRRRYTLDLKEDAPDPATLNVDSISVLTPQGAPAGIELSKSGTDFIGLTQGNTTTFKLAFHFNGRTEPMSISPNPDAPLDYSVQQTFTVQYTPQVSKQYTIKIGKYNPSALQITPIKGVWLTNVASNALLSQAGIAECVNLCRDLGINTIFMVVYNNSKTMYPSDVMQEYFGFRIDPVYGSRDPLAELIALAKPHNIKVVAWFEYGFASVYGDNTGGPIIGRYPSWASRDINGRITEKNNFYWLDPFNPDVQRFMRRLVTEVVEKYPDIDGVQGDDRLPALPTNGGYNPVVVEQYLQETGRNAPSNYLDPQWLRWRADKLNDFGEYIYKHIKAIDSRYIVSMSPSPYVWSYQNYLQDWPTWVRNKQLDYVHPQCYRYSFNDYKASLDANYAHISQIPGRDILFSPGVLLGTGSGDGITPQILEQILTYNRSIGLQGEVYFYYERIRQNPGFQTVIRNH